MSQVQCDHTKYWFDLELSSVHLLLHSSVHCHGNSVRTGCTCNNLLPYGVTKLQTTHRTNKSYTGNSLTVLASHSCLGRSLVTPIRLSSLARHGKENTADRKTQLKWNMSNSQIKDRLFILKRKSVTHHFQKPPPLLHSHLLYSRRNNREWGRDDRKK